MTRIYVVTYRLNMYKIPFIDHNITKREPLLEIECQESAQSFKRYDTIFILIGFSQHFILFALSFFISPIKDFLLGTDNSQMSYDKQILSVNSKKTFPFKVPGALIMKYYCTKVFTFQSKVRKKIFQHLPSHTYHICNLQQQHLKNF